MFLWIRLSNCQMKISKNKSNYFEYMSIKYDIPKELLIGIFTIETTYRKFYHRLAENILTVLSIVLNILFNGKVKNYTVGRCQIGLATILSLSGNYKYRHSKHITNLTFKDLLIIMKAMNFKGSVEVCASHLRVLYEKELSRGADEEILIRRIGEEFNGRYIYGLILEDMYNDLRCKSKLKVY